VVRSDELGSTINYSALERMKEREAKERRTERNIRAMSRALTSDISIFKPITSRSVHPDLNKILTDSQLFFNTLG